MWRSIVLPERAEPVTDMEVLWVGKTGHSSYVVATDVFSRIRNRVELVARIDPLTGAYNLRGIMEFLERELARAARRDEPLSG